MRTNMLLSTIVLLFAAVLSFHSRLSAAPHDHDNDPSRYTVREDETIRKTFTLTAGQAAKLEVDNVWGSIKVTGTSGNEVQLVVSKSIRAESQDDLASAKKDVKLDMTQEGNAVRLFVDGPFRCNCDDRNGFHMDGDLGYLVKMDFELQVPQQTDLRLATVNMGNINVQNVTGSFRVGNVNGSIDMADMVGSGRAHTVNGHVKVAFRQNPRENSDFASINGAVELYFDPNLSADFRLKNFNGGIFSDFEMTSLPPRASSETRKNGKFIFRSDRFMGVRVGSGGPEITVENLNGEIRILNHHV